MIVLVAVALAQSEGKWLESACELANPIAGTAGYENARNAIRTNATTYSAGAFARRRMRKQVVLAWDMRAVYGVAMVPAFCGDPDGRRGGDVYLEPLDLHATNLGLNLPLLERGPLNSQFRLFYASSVTSSTTWNRAFTFFGPMFNMYPTFFAPVIGNTTTGTGLGSYGVDWIGGALFRSDVVSVQAGYTGQRGFYADVTQEEIALFVNGVADSLDDGLQASDLSYWMGGIQDLDTSKARAPKEAGLSSAYFRSLPQRAKVAVDEPASLLRTVHLAQADMFRAVDVSASLDVGERPSLRELTAAWHTSDFVVRDGERAAEGQHAYIRAGVVHLPGQPLLGVDGGVFPVVQAVYRQTGGEAELKLAAQLNDPELLDLYPFATNAFGLSVELTWRMDD